MSRCDLLLYLRKILCDYRNCKFVHVTGNSIDVILLSNYINFVVYNDIEKIIFSFFRVIRSKYEMFLNLLQSGKGDIIDSDLDVVQAVNWYTDLVRMVLECDREAFDRLGGVNVYVPDAVKEYLLRADYLLQVYLRLCTVQFDCVDYSDCIYIYDSPSTFFYAEFGDGKRDIILQFIREIANVNGYYFIVIDSCFCDALSDIDFVSFKVKDEFCIISNLKKTVSFS